MYLLLFFLRGEPFDRGLVHSIESVIIEWTHQIQSVLKRNSAQPLLEGHNPGPLVELDFWKARAANLECIFEQVSITSTAEIDSISINCYLFIHNIAVSKFLLNKRHCFNITQLHDVKVRRMAELLEKTQSSYFPAFKKIFKDVVAGKFFLVF